MNEIILILIFLTGLAAVVFMTNIFKKIFGLGIMNSAIVLLFILRGSEIGSFAPILDGKASDVVDPVPQALMLTAIVISVCITALALGLARNLHLKYGTFDIDKIRKGVDDGE